MPGTQELWETMYTKQRRIAEAAEKYAGKSLYSIAHFIDKSNQRFAGCIVPMN